jgi:uncharacterized protein YcbK (DUF882 family)
MGDLSAHFSKREFSCKDGCGFDTPNKSLLDFLEELRYALGEKPIYITRNGGCRCRKQNHHVGGAIFSQHILGKAADIYIPGIHPLVVAKVAKQLMPWTGGVGLYDLFVHVDVRIIPARWVSK